MSEESLKRWLALATIGFAVCLLGWISTSNVLSVSNKTTVKSEHAMQSIVDDANQKYNALLNDATQSTDNMVTNFSSVCDELWGGSVQDDCHDNAQSNFNTTNQYSNNPININDYYSPDNSSS
jgi:hypothetical protein